MEREQRPAGTAAERSAAEVLATGSLVEVGAGIAAIVLGILGLNGIVAQTLAAIGVIVVGVALLFEGTTIILRYAQLTRPVDSRPGTMELSGGVTLEFLGGLGVAVLGVLALLDLAPIKLMAIGVIAYGATLLLSAGTLARLNPVGMENQRSPTQATLAQEAVLGSEAIQLLSGVAGVILGVVAVVEIHPLTLILVALLTFGSAIVLSGSTLTGQMLRLVRG